jgi:Putative zinc-finger
MSGLTCEEVAEMAAELALDALPGDQRARMLEHLAGCPACRDIVEQLAETADALLSAYASVDPPPGFEARTLAAMQIAPRRRPSRVLALAAAAAAVVALVAGGVHLAAPAGTSDGTVEAAGQQQLRTVQLIATSGQAIGDVSAYSGQPVWIFMRVSQGHGGGTYRCVLDVSGGGTVSLGTLSLTAGRGGWGQNVSVDLRRIVRARMVSSTGETVATATF